MTINALRSARRVLKGGTLQHQRARYRSASLVGQTCWLSSQCGSAWNEFRTRTRDRRNQRPENRPEYHYGRNERLVGDRCKSGLRCHSHLLLNAAGNLSLRISARDRGRSLHGRIRRAAGRVFAGCHSTLAGRISVANGHPFCFSVFRKPAPARGVECPKLHAVFQPHSCLRCLRPIRKSLRLDSAPCFWV